MNHRASLDAVQSRPGLLAATGHHLFHNDGLSFAGVAYRIEVPGDSN